MGQGLQGVMQGRSGLKAGIAKPAAAAMQEV